MKALILSPEGTVEKAILEPVDGSYLEPLQELVGGLIEFAPTFDPEIEMVVNEEGLLIGLPVNLQASLTSGRPIVGTAVLVPAGEFD